MTKSNIGLKTFIIHIFLLGTLGASSIIFFQSTSKSSIFVAFSSTNSEQIAKFRKDVFEVKEIAVNSKQFQKVLKEYENDPTKGIKQIQMGGTSIILTGKDGTSTKIAKEQEERLKARIKKDNNRIELDIVK